MKKSRLMGAVCAVFLGFVSLPSHAAPVSGQGTWEATLEGRDLDGDLTTAEAFYDTVLDITWLADANYAGTTMDWATAKNWATSLDFGNGINNWRLPKVDGPHTSNYYVSYVGAYTRGYNISSPQGRSAGSTKSEMAYMYYNTLGNLGSCDPILSSDGSNSCYSQAGSGLSNTGPFNEIQAAIYWSSTQNSIDPTYAYIFIFSNGKQDIFSSTKDSFAWAVHDGDVGAPIASAPVYGCVGGMFESPFNEVITLKSKVKKAIPVKMTLVDADGYFVTNMNISSPPVVSVSYVAGSGVEVNNNSDLVPPGLADDGNEFRYDDPHWIINLATKQFTSAGTYEVTAVAGDDSYIIDANSCAGTFIRLP